MKPVSKIIKINDGLYRVIDMTNTYPSVDHDSFVSARSAMAREIKMRRVYQKMARRHVGA